VLSNLWGKGEREGGGRRGEHLHAGQEDGGSRAEAACGGGVRP
jgi:hypothetical protein